MLAIASVPFTSCSQDDDNYEDTKVEFDLKKGQNKIEIPHLKPYDMNDKTTSFCAFTLQDTQNFFELFEDDNYKRVFRNLE